MEKTKIILIEDDEILAKVVYEELKEAGFDVLQAFDGEGGLKLAFATAKEADLILLDLLMPKKNGFEVLDELKKSSITRDIPVIILTMLGSDEDIKKGLKMGANDYIVKSQHAVSEIVEKVKNFFEKEEHPKAGQKQESPAKPTAPTPSAPPSPTPPVAPTPPAKPAPTIEPTPATPVPPTEAVQQQTEIIPKQIDGQKQEQESPDPSTTTPISAPVEPTTPPLSPQPIPEEQPLVEPTPVAKPTPPAQPDDKTPSAMPNAEAVQQQIKATPPKQPDGKNWN